MESIIVGLIQGNFRNAFQEKHVQIRRISDYKETMGYPDFVHNHKLLVRLIRDAAKKGAQLVITPESYLDGWSAQDNLLKQVATTIDGVFVEELKALALDLGIWICVGLFIKEEARLYNEALLIDAAGVLTHAYRKTHETGDVLKQMPYDLGDELAVADAPWGKTGLLICHDRWYPENYRTLRVRGAEVILNPVMSATLWPGHPYFEIHRATIRSHAYANSLFILSCNGANHGGHSFVVAPDGSVVCEGGQEQEVVLCGIDPSKYGSYDFISNLNPDIYAI